MPPPPAPPSPAPGARCLVPAPSPPRLVKGPPSASSPGLDRPRGPGRTRRKDGLLVPRGEGGGIRVGSLSAGLEPDPSSAAPRLGAPGTQGTRGRVGP